MNQPNNVFFSQGNNYQLNNLMMQYMMMSNYGRNIMQNALMFNNRNLAMGFNQPYTMNNVAGSTTNSNNANNLKTTKVNDSFKEKNSYYSQKQKNSFENANYNYSNNNDSIIEVKKPTKHYTKEELEEINKWILSRKRNFPTKENINQKELLGKKREEAGMISKLELKLRKKVTILKKLDSRGKGFTNKSLNRKTLHNKYNNNNRCQKKQNIIKPIKKTQNIKNEEPPEEGEILEEGQIEEEEKRNNNFKEEPDNQKENEKTAQNKKEIDTNNKGNIEENNKSQKSLTKNRNMKKAKENFPFKYKHNFLYENMIKKDVIKEQNIILQAFRYFINEGLI